MESETQCDTIQESKNRFRQREHSYNIHMINNHFGAQ